jgi:hypothetical protein
LEVTWPNLVAVTMTATPKLIDDENRSARQLIVQCPKCETKFAIEADGVEDLEFPRFHCSRCDNVFGFDESGAQPLTLEKQTSITPSTTFSVTPGSPKSQDSQFEVNSTPSEPSPVVSTASSARQTTFNPFSNPRDIVAPSSRGFTLGNVAAKEQRGETFAQAQQALAVADGDNKKGWGGVGLIALPILGLLTLCAVLFITSQSATGAKALGSMISTGAPEAAPADLRLGQISAKTVTLDNGELIYVFNMSLTNNTEDIFKEVIVEGLLYDEGGKLLGAERISAASSLTKARIRSLSVEMIRSLQSGKLVRKFELSPGEETDITFAVLAPSEEVKFFSGRIFSAAK